MNTLMKSLNSLDALLNEIRDLELVKCLISKSEWYQLLSFNSTKIHLKDHGITHDSVEARVVILKTAHLKNLRACASCIFTFDTCESNK